MADNAFVSADIDKIAKFESDSQDAIAEFDAIKTKFNDINAALLKKWEGEGATIIKLKSNKNPSVNSKSSRSFYVEV